MRVGDLRIDYSKHLITDETLALLQELATVTDVFGLRDAMFRGERINVTEDRAVAARTALRAPRNAVIEVDGENVVPECTPCSTRWPTSPRGSAPASGPATPASASRTSSTSVSAAPISARRWRTRRCGPSPTVR